MKFKQLTIVMMMALMLSACSGLSDRPLNTDLNSNLCCTKLAELPLIELTEAHQQRLVIDGELPTLTYSLLHIKSQENEQHLPVVAFNIDDKQSPFSLMLRSYVDNKALFAPSVVMFDAHWQQVGYYSSKEFHYQPSSMKGLERIEAIIEINPQRDDVHYIVIVADASMLNETLERIHPEQLYAQTQQIIGQKRLPLSATYQKIGVIDVTTSSSNNPVFLALLAEFGSAKMFEGNKLNNSQNDKSSIENWPYYQQKIDQALLDGDLKKAAIIANKASEAGLPQAKDYLLKRLTE